jgi:hypothetical protein
MGKSTDKGCSFIGVNVVARERVDSEHSVLSRLSNMPVSS